MIKPKLSKRLDLLASIAKDYSPVWDLCCDHGQLACFLKREHPLKDVYALDIQEHIIQKIAQELQEEIHLIHGDASTFLFSDFTIKSKSLFIIAGVGAHLTQKIIENILNQYRESEVYFLLCPHQDSFYLRYFLQKANMKMLDEFWLQEKGVGYDILLMANVPREHSCVPLINKQMDAQSKEALHCHLSLKRKFNSLCEIEKATYDEISL